METEMAYQVIKQITNNYDNERILGRGGFGTVYKAVHDGETIAVKVFDVPRSDDNEFRKEFDNLKRLKHENIVELVGFCNDIEEIVYTDVNGKQVPAGKLHTALCLEYVQNGHLGDYISDETTGLHWGARYQIIKGVCEGLKYLHEGLNPPMLHLDLKPENILLDKGMIPKVADFGLSRLFGEEKTTKAASTCGSKLTAQDPRAPGPACHKSSPRERVANKLLNIRFIPTGDKVADGSTKPLTVKQQETFRRNSQLK